MDDNFYQRLINEGVSEQIRMNQAAFQSCTYCEGSYTKVRPNLLNCGHFICNDCWKLEQKCFYPGCPGAKGVKVFAYDIYCNSIIQNDQSTEFQFGLKTIKQQKSMIKKVKGSATVGDIAQDFIAKYFFANNGGQDKALIVIGSQLVTYKDVKYKKINDLKVQMNLLSIQQSPYTINPFLLTQRYNGGTKINDSL